MKTANISLIYQTEDESFIINLVDTPGHVDFTGKVTRALRSIDGAIVVVDAVEEIMAQTEIVVRQALEERVRPVLFINKTDKLITELKLNASEIEKKLNRIIGTFNDLIELHGESLFKTEWKVSPEKGSVVFGSALHRWGFTLAEARQRGIRFSDIIDAYQTRENERLTKIIPLHKAILNATITKICDPLEAQRYRAEKIWKGDLSSVTGQGIINCDDSGPLVMNLTNVQVQSDGKVIATGRVFSGTLKKGDIVHLVNAREEGTISQVSLYMGAFTEPVDHVNAGNLAAISGLENVKAGETVVDADHQRTMVPFERIRYVSEPVLTVMVEPRNPQSLPLLFEAMEKLAAEDPNLATMVNKETGEYVLNGMGELHLETATKRLRDMIKGTEIQTSSPRVVLKESIFHIGKVVASKSPNKQNKVVVQVEPLADDFIRLIELENVDTKKVGDILATDEDKNVLADCTGKTEQTHRILDSIISGFKYACKAGPLCGEPIRAVKINLINVQLSEDPEKQGEVEITHAMGKAIFGSFLTAKPGILEPLYKTVISAPTELAGECSRIVRSRRGKVSNFEQKGAIAVITCLIPVAETFGFSQELRSTTSGRALWQSTFYQWEKMPEKLEAKIITETRKRKGLSPEVPTPEQFTEEDQ